jgi:hypothetical protein
MKRTSLIIAALGLFLFVQVAQADWTPAKRLTWTSGPSEAAAIAADSSGHLHVVWSDGTPGNTEISYRRSLDEGITWQPIQRLTWTPGTSWAPAIAVEASGSIHMVWYDDSSGNDEVYYKKSTDGGATWTPSLKLTWSAGFSVAQTVAVDAAGGLHVVFSDNTPGEFEIYYKKSTDNGDSWTASRRLTWTPGDSYVVSMDISPSNQLHLVWTEDGAGSEEVYYRKSTDGGASWTASQRLTWTTSPSLSPGISVDSLGRLHLIWQDNMSGNIDLYYKRSSDAGASWTASQRLTWTTGLSFSPDSVIHPPANLHVVWQDDTPGNYEIYYKKSTDGGATWTTSQRLTWNSSWSGSPDVAVAPSGHPHVVWEDNAPGNYEICYKQDK